MAPPLPTAGQPAGITLGSLNKLPLAGRIGIGAVLCALVAVVYWVFFYSDISAKITSTKSAQGQLQANLASEQQAQATYFADRDELALRQQRQREFNKILPADTEVAGFLSSIQSVANSSGIQLNAWQPKDEQVEQFYAKVPMSLEIAGKFHQIVKFAYDLGKLDRITNLENLDIAPAASQTSDEPVLKVKCLATAFHALKTQAAPAPTGGK